MFWTPLKVPGRFSDSLIPANKKALAIKLLREGEPVNYYLGSAQCRICKERLGCADLSGFGFLWPEKAEHYIEKHSVWLPEIDELVQASLQKSGA